MTSAVTITDLEADNGGAWLRWGIAGAVVVGAHAALVAAAMIFTPPDLPAGASSPPILIDFSPEAAAPESEADLAPGPESAESQEASEPEAPQEVAEEPVMEVPPAPVPKPEVALPEKKEVVEKQEEPMPDPPPLPTKKPEKRQVQSVARPTSNPKLAKRSRAVAAPNPGSAASRTAIPQYRNILSAHLQRFKRPPAGGGSGTAVVTFTVDRNGRVVSRSLARSSGSRNLDAEALAMIARAQPMPPFPAAITQTRLAFTQAIRFN